MLWPTLWNASFRPHKKCQMFTNMGNNSWPLRLVWPYSVRPAADTDATSGCTSIRSRPHRLPKRLCEDRVHSRFGCAERLTDVAPVRGEIDLLLMYFLLFRIVGFFIGDRKAHLAARMQYVQ